jgi:peptidoglycan hydrolase FlgJ
MTSRVDNAQIYGDFAGLQALKKGARANDPSTIRQVARQFESLFARMMIKSMRDAIGKDPIFGGSQSEMYQGLFDDQLSLEMTKGRGLGLADMLVRQLQQRAGVGGAASTSGSAGATGTAGSSRGSSAAGSTASSGVATPIASTADQQSFISAVWGEAQQAAQQLGVHPVSLVAQAALESNWGRSVPHDASGSSHNLFGIKTGTAWQGQSVTADTQEFQGTSAASEPAAFRAYGSAAQSFQDYVALLSTNPRYSGALGSGANVQTFATALQQGGYATDPDYARKLAAVAGQVRALLQPRTDRDGTLKLTSAAPIASSAGSL